jgi:hypothetical protein
MFGYAAPAGAFPSGGAAWQEAQFKAVSGDPAGAGVAGWFAGLFGDPVKWQNAQTAAFEVFVST